MIKVGLISLGCAKNLIDSEVMIGHLQLAGMAMTPEPELADVLIVNTCSFIDNAKKESIAAIHGAIDDRESDAKRHRQKIIVAGCLSQRFRQELPSLMPEVDAFIDSQLKAGPKLATLGKLQVESGMAFATLVSKTPIKEARLHHAAAKGAWQSRDWKTIPAEIVDGKVKAKLPADMPLVFYLSVVDEKGVEVSTTHLETPTPGK